MPGYLRPKVTGATVFFTVALAERGDDLLVREVARLREAVRLTRAERPFGIDAWVVLPDHLHALWTLPAGDAAYATRWRLIKSRFSRGLPMGHLRPSHRNRGERGIWQRRFWEHHIRDAEDFRAHMEFCRTSPVRLGLVDNPGDWPYSSFSRP
jgi:putative transposase